MSPRKEPPRDAVYRRLFANGAEAMTGILAMRASNADPAIPAILLKLLPRVLQRYAPPEDPDAGGTAIADQLFAAGSRAVLDVMLEQTGITDPTTISRLERLGANVARVARR